MADLMFAGTETWNPSTGCPGGCPYCYARVKMLPRVSHFPQYAHGFAPTFHWDILEEGPPRCRQLFVVSMGDLWCDAIRSEEVGATLDCCHKSPKVGTYLFLTKFPGRFVQVLNDFPIEDKRFIFGATIETTAGPEDRAHAAIGPRTPDPALRFAGLLMLKREFPQVRRFISIEPVIDFDRLEMVNWVKAVEPEFVYIGYDNHKLVPANMEPPLPRVLELIKELRANNIEVREKTIRGARA